MAHALSSTVAFSALQWGTHLCHFYATPQDLLDTLAPFFKAGLEKHECCLWVVSPTLTTDQAGEALRRRFPDFDRQVREGLKRLLELDGRRDVFGDASTPSLLSASSSLRSR